MCLCEVGLNSECSGDQLDGEFVFFYLIGKHPQHVCRVGLVGFSLQYLLIEAFRIGQAARRVVLYGEFYCLLDGQCLLLFSQ